MTGVLNGKDVAVELSCQKYRNCLYESIAADGETNRSLIVETVPDDSVVRSHRISLCDSVALSLQRFHCW